MKRPLSDLRAAPLAPGKSLTDAQARDEMRRITRRSFASGAVAALAGAAGWGWLRSRPEEGGLAWPLRMALDLNERIAGSYFDGRRLAPMRLCVGLLVQEAEPHVVPLVRTN